MTSTRRSRRGSGGEVSPPVPISIFDLGPFITDAVNKVMEGINKQRPGVTRTRKFHDALQRKLTQAVEQVFAIPSDESVTSSGVPAPNTAAQLLVAGYAMAGQGFLAQGIEAVSAALLDPSMSQLASALLDHINEASAPFLAANSEPTDTSADPFAPIPGVDPDQALDQDPVLDPEGATTVDLPADDASLQASVREALFAVRQTEGFRRLVGAVDLPNDDGTEPEAPPIPPDEGNPADPIEPNVMDGSMGSDNGATLSFEAVHARTQRLMGHVVLPDFAAERIRRMVGC